MVLRPQPLLWGTNAEGAPTCMHRPGFVSCCPATASFSYYITYNPRYFIDGGRPVVFMGRYHADFICSTCEHFTRDLPGYMNYLAEELNANFTQVWAIMIFSGRKEAGYGVNTGGAMFMPFLRTGPGTNYYELVYLNFDECWDPWRDEPRFEAVRQEVGLPRHPNFPAK